MAEDKTKTNNRRLLIQKALRYAALAVLGFAAGGAIMKNRKLSREGKCANRGICTGCGIYKNCRLPQALSKKQTLAE